MLKKFGVSTFHILCIITTFYHISHVPVKNHSSWSPSNGGTQS